MTFVRWVLGDIRRPAQAALIGALGVIAVSAITFQLTTHMRPVGKVAGLQGFSESFVGTAIQTGTYKTKSLGGGSIRQNDKLITAGKSSGGVLWNVLYTKGDAGLQTTVSSQARVALTTTGTLDGDAMAILGVEKRSRVATGNQSGAFCELSKGSHGTILRMENTSGTPSDSVSLSTTTGTLALSYNPRTAVLTCRFGGASVSLAQPTAAGPFALTLRSGLHKIVTDQEGLEAAGHGTEHGGTGNYTATFDDWRVTVGK